MTFVVQLRYVMKVVSAAAWVIILPVTYSYTLNNPTGFARTIKGWFGDGKSQPSLYIVAVLIYLSPHFLAATLFLIPYLRIILESSNFRVIMVMMWWAQVIYLLIFQTSLCEINLLDSTQKKKKSCCLHSVVLELIQNRHSIDKFHPASTCNHVFQ